MVMTPKEKKAFVARMKKGRAAAKKNKKKRGAQIQKPKSVGTFEDRLSDIIINFNIKIEKAFEKEGADLDNHNIEQIVDAVKQSWYTTLLQEHEWNLQY